LGLDVGPGDGVGVVSENQCSLNSQVHDHESLCSQLVWENLERVGDEETGPGERVEYTEQPDEGNLRIS
jgi:hypothetical protein